MQTNIFAISGGPCVGKTTIIKELGKLGFNIIPESARIVAENDERFKGKNIKEINMAEFQKEILNMQIKLHEDFLLRNSSFAFSDRGFGDTIAYYKLNGLNFPGIKKDYVKNFRYAGVFILEPLKFYKTDGLRTETKEEQTKIHEEIEKSYGDLGYDLIKIPQMPIEGRIALILRFQKSLKGS